MKFIAFEGLDGTGKSSLMAALEAQLKEKGVVYVRTREPGGTPLSEEIRQWILRKDVDTVPVPRAELLLYEAARAQHVDQFIKPTLKKGHWVLSDRYAASSVAFQAGGRVIPESAVHALNDFATDNLYPDLYILLDLSVEGSKARRLKRSVSTSEVEDRMESEAADFHERVRQGYLKQAKENPTSWLVLDANQSTEKMLEIVMQYLRDKKWLA